MGSRRVRNYFIAGVLVIAPTALSFYFLYQSFLWVDNLLAGLLQGLEIGEFTIPARRGVGFGAVVLIILIVGFLTSGYLGSRILQVWESMVSAIPLINRMYPALKQIGTSVLAEQNRAFREAVLIEYPRKGVFSLAFATKPPPPVIQQHVDRELISVFLPTTPNPTSGFLLMVPRSEAITLDIPVEEALKLVISGGMVAPEAESAGAELVALDALPGTDDDGDHAVPATTGGGIEPARDAAERVASVATGADQASSARDAGDAESGGGAVAGRSEREAAGRGRGRSRRGGRRGASSGRAEGPRDGGGGGEGEVRDGRGRDETPRAGRGRDEGQRDGRGRDETPRAGRGRDETPRDGRGRDETPRDGRGRDETPRDGRGRDETPRAGRGRDEGQRTGRGRGDRPREGRGGGDRARDDRARGRGRGDRVRDDESRGDRDRSGRGRDDRSSDDRARDRGPARRSGRPDGRPDAGEESRRDSGGRDSGRSTGRSSRESTGPSDREQPGDSGRGWSQSPDDGDDRPTPRRRW